MKTKKLELKHLAAYLPYNVKMFANGFIGTLQTLNIDNITQSGYKIRVNCSDWWENNNIDGKIYKPILHPLSDLTKEIEVNGNKFIPVIELMDLYGMTLELNENMHLIQPITLEPYILIRQLFEWHFDCFNLIPNGLAIDINTLTQPK